MSRSGYSYDCENLELYRQAVNRAVNGKRGQAFLRDLLSALDAMPDKRLIPQYLYLDGSVCALGSLGIARGIDMRAVDPNDRDQVAEVFGIAPSLAAEVEYENDEAMPWESFEHRWERMRRWVTSLIVGGE